MSTDLSFIHTADLHLGRSFREYGRQGRELRRRIVGAIERAAQAAIERRVRLLFVAGDLFDSKYPAREAAEILDSILGRLSSAGIKTVIIPGTHDPPGSPVYSSRVFASRPHDVIVLGPEQLSVVLPELDLAVGAWFPSREHAREWIGPPDGWHRRMKFRVGMAHGSDPFGQARDELIPAALFQNRDLHYIALGHHHGNGPVAQSSVAAYYSGSPEILAVDQKAAGFVNHVTLSDKSGEVAALVEKVKTGTLHYKKINLDAAEIAAGRDPARDIEPLADPDLILEAVMEGAADEDAQIPDPDAMVERFGKLFFRLRVIDRATRSVPASASAPPNTVLHEFVSRMEQKIRESEGEERAEWEDALRLGLTYLRGRDQA